VRSVQGDAILTIEPPEAADACRVSVLAEAQLTASVVVALRQRFEDFFAEIARDWRGWEGERVFSACTRGAVAESLRLIATADGRGHVRLVVQLGRPWLPSDDTTGYQTHVGLKDPEDGGAWVATVSLTLETAQLDEIAAGAGSLGLSPEPSGPQY
jgi:hypothetical protein